MTIHLRKVSQFRSFLLQVYCPFYYGTVIQTGMTYMKTVVLCVAQLASYVFFKKLKYFPVKHISIVKHIVKHI